MEFTKKDLALLLPDQAGDATSLRFTHDGTAEDAPSVTLQPKIDPSKKVKIYRAGQVPVWGKSQDENETNTVSRRKDKGVGGVTLPAAVKPQVTTVEEKLEGFGSLQSETLIEANDEKRRATAREKAKARVVVEAEEIVGSSDEELESAYNKSSNFDDMAVPGDVPTIRAKEEEEEDVTARRERIRAKLREKSEVKIEQNDIHQLLPTQPSIDFLETEDKWKHSAKEEETEEESDEWETDSGSEEEVDEVMLLKPVFVSKEKRKTLIDQRIKEEEAEVRARREAQELENRKRQTRQMIAEEIRRDQEKAAQAVEAVASDVDLPDDADDPENLLEFEAWKVREMQRLTRDKEEKEALVKEKAETERRRNLTEEERKKEDRETGQNNQMKNKSKWTFMQKYYHPGAFYMDEDSIKSKEDVRLRDNTAPTGEDKFKKEALPKVMQVRNFGRSGQSKWTHLSAEDTTNHAAPFLMSDRMIRSKMEQKMAGTGDVDKPFQKKKIAPPPPVPFYPPG